MGQVFEILAFLGYSLYCKRKGLDFSPLHPLKVRRRTGKFGKLYPESWSFEHLCDLKTLIYTPFSKASPLKINTLEEEDFTEIPMRNQVTHLISYMAGGKEIKLSQAGYLPQKIIKELCDIGIYDSLVFATQ